MGDNEPTPSSGAGIEISVSINIDAFKQGRAKLTRDQVCRLLSSVGNQVLTWMRYDVKDSRNIPVVAHEGTQEWRSDDTECRGTEYD